jgi:hypothetical protein
MKTSLTKIASGLTAAVIVAGGILGTAIAPASAVLTAAEIRLVTPVLVGGTTAWDGQQLADQWVVNTWYAAGITYKRTYAPVGSDIVLTYYATDADTGAPLVNTDVKLRVNKAYSGSNALVKVGSSLTASGIERSNGTDQLQVTAKTDQFGYVTFVLDNTDTVGEPQPETLSTEPPALAQDADPTVSLYSQIYPEITGQSTDKADMTEFHYYTPGANPLVVANKAAGTVARVKSPGLVDTSATPRQDLETLFSVTNNWYAVGIKVWQKWHAIGTTSNLVYSVTDANGIWLGNNDVTLSVGKAYSGSTANVTNGSTATNLGAAADQDQAQWTGKTDPFGTVMFNLQNTDTEGSEPPAAANTAPPVPGVKFSQIWPVVAGTSSNVADMLEYHFFKPVAPPKPLVTSVVVTRAARVISVTVNNPKVKYTFRVPAGSTKVVASCNGKSKTVTYKIK